MFVIYIKLIFEKFMIAYDPIRWARQKGVQVGENCRFLGIKPSTFSTEPYLVHIGNHVTLTSGVQFVTHDGGVWVFRDEYNDIDTFGKITIGNNVFIGINTIILPRVTIGDNCVVGAGSVVPAGNYEANSIIAGNPARKIKDIASYKVNTMSRAFFIRNQTSREKEKILSNKLP